MPNRTGRLSLDELRRALRDPAGRVLDPGDPVEAVEELWRLGMRSASSSALGSAMWQIWGRIFDEWTHPNGDPRLGAEWARESAVDLLEAVGDAPKERDYCDKWVYDERLGIILAEPR